MNRPVNIPTVPSPSTQSRFKSDEPPIRSSTFPKKQSKIIDIDHTNKNQQYKKDQPTRLLKRLPQAKVLGDVDLKHLIKKNDLVVVINEEADDFAESSSLDSSVADEKAGLRKCGLKSALITSANQLKLSKKVMFIGGERDGAEVSAIYLYEAVAVDVPWQVPKCRGEADLKAYKGGPIPAALISAPIGFRPY